MWWAFSFCMNLLLFIWSTPCFRLSIRFPGHLYCIWLLAPVRNNQKYTLSGNLDTEQRVVPSPVSYRLYNAWASSYHLFRDQNLLLESQRQYRFTHKFKIVSSMSSWNLVLGNQNEVRTCGGSLLTANTWQILHNRSMVWASHMTFITSVSCWWYCFSVCLILSLCQYSD